MFSYQQVLTSSSSSSGVCRLVLLVILQQLLRMRNSQQQKKSLGAACHLAAVGTAKQHRRTLQEFTTLTAGSQEWGTVTPATSITLCIMLLEMAMAAVETQQQILWLWCMTLAAALRPAATTAGVLGLRQVTAGRC
jgi:hypothetical protein